MDGEDDGFATGLSTAICKDGQSTPTANIGFGGFKVTNIAAATARTDAARASHLQDNDLTYYTTGGVADALTLTPAPAVTSYTAGQGWFIKISAANLTTTPTLAVSGLTAKTIVNCDGSALGIGDLALSGVYRVVYESTAGQFFLVNKLSQLSFGLTDGGKKTANFTAAANTKYRMKGVASSITATLPTGGTDGDVIVLVAYGNYGGQACGTINGVAKTIQFQQQTLPLTYSATVGWV